ncbi:MAG: ribose 5-phosphate isomerase B [Mycoplasmatales bacterium]
MKIIIGSDHAGKEQRLKLIEFLKEKNYEIEDCGTHKEEANYVTEGIKVAENIAMGNGDLGIIICGTGIGISIAANKVNGIRCAVLANEEMAKYAKMHNDANVIALGGRTIDYETNVKIIEQFLAVKFEGGRHKSRILSIQDYEKSCIC